MCLSPPFSRGGNFGLHTWHVVRLFEYLSPYLTVALSAATVCLNLLIVLESPFAQHVLELTYRYLNLLNLSSKCRTIEGDAFELLVQILLFEVL